MKRQSAPAVPLVPAPSLWRQVFASGNKVWIGPVEGKDWDRHSDEQSVWQADVNCAYQRLGRVVDTVLAVCTL
jgi:hypothetical protein